jgi:hypothetical protein
VAGMANPNLRRIVFKSNVLRDLLYLAFPALL